MKCFQIRFKVDVREIHPQKTKEWLPERYVRASVWANSEEDALELVAEKLKVELD